MKVTVLGTYGGFPAKNKACMGHLIETENTKILVDCGSGCASRLQNFINIEELDAIVLSHLHHDHYTDLFIIRYAIEVGMKFSNSIKPIDLYLPMEPLDSYKEIEGMSAFNIIKLYGQENLSIGDINVSFKKTKHNLETYAMTFENSGNKIGYTADAGYMEELIPFFANSDILIGEASLLNEQKNNTPFHMTTSEVTTLAEKANVKKLLLTHFWYQFEPNVYLKEAKELKTKCIVETAEECKVYEITNCEQEDANSLLNKIAESMGGKVTTWNTVNEAVERNINFAKIVDTSAYISEEEKKKLNQKTMGLH